MVTGGGAGLLIPATVAGLGGVGLVGGGANGFTNNTWCGHVISDITGYDVTW